MTTGKLFHIIHMTGDLPALEAWYDDVFAVRRGFLDHNYMPGEKRDASLVVLGDSVIEPLAPAFRVDGWDSDAAGPVLQPVRQPLALHRLVHRRRGRDLAALHRQWHPGAGRGAACWLPSGPGRTRPS